MTNVVELSEHRIKESNPTFNFYHNGESIGTLVYVDGQFIFEGDADASAKVFFDAVIASLNTRIESLVGRQGCVPVPKEPTEEMTRAGAVHCRNNFYAAERIYKAMIAVAPKGDA